MNSTNTFARGKTLALILGVTALILLVLAPSAFAGKIVDRVVVGTKAAGTGEGQFADGAGATSPAGLAFNDPNIADNTADPQGDSTDGYLYVADPGNHRIQAFDAAGDFKFMFGRGVLSGGDGAEVCDHTQTPCEAGIADDEAGELTQPLEVAINQQTGDLYIYGGGSGQNNFRIDQFAADGTFIRAWGWGVATGASAFEICTGSCRKGIAGPNGGQMPANGFFGGIAVDPSSPHHVFHANGDLNRIQEFEADGDFVRLWGRDVVNTGQPGNIGTEAFEVCSSTATGVCKAGITGGFAGADDALDRPNKIAVDGNGVVYTTGAMVVALYRFDSDAATVAAMPLSRIPNSALVKKVESGSIPNAWGGDIGSLTIDPNSDNLLAAYGIGNAAALISEFDTSVEHPVVVGVHMENAAFPAAEQPSAVLRTSALAVDPASGDFYFSGAGGSSETGHRVFASDDDGANPAPTLAIDDPSSTVNGPNVTLSGEVTPNGPAGIPTIYNFQYRKVGSGEAGWITVPGSENPLGDGSTAVEVSDSVSDLQPHTDYEVRLATRRAFRNPEIQSAALTFTSAAAPPEAKTLAPQARSATSATLAALVNPNNSATSYRFEWGETASYGNVTPIGDAGDDFGDRLVTAKIAGLDPETTYHYRVVADNGFEVSPGDTEVEGDDVSFGTRAAVTTVGERGLELVTPPFKVTRQTGNPQGSAGENPNPSIASLDGDTVHWNVSILPLTDDVASPMTGDRRIIRRSSSGWVNSTRNTLELLAGTDPHDELFSPAYLTKVGIGGSSGDFESLSVVVRDNLATNAGLLPTEGKYANRAYTRRDGTGTKGFTAWLTNSEVQILDQGFTRGLPSKVTEVINAGWDQALFNDSGSAIARWGHYRGLAENTETAFNEDPSDEQQLDGQMGGASTYVQRAGNPDVLPTAPKELVNACTGTVGGGDATLIPARVGSGTATDTIGTQTCVRGKVTNVRGAVMGDRGGTQLPSGRAATALADDGNRIFFQSPDRFAATEADGNSSHPSVLACSTGTGTNTACPPQLFVRQYDPEGIPTVRWVSQSRSVANGDGSYGGTMIAGQRIAEMGAGARFEGASRDGSVVYFRTNAPLTPDDPNGGKSITTESADPKSWDLYRYELPESLEADPSGGTLMRVTGGPLGTADPSTASNSTSANLDASIRFHSDDGERAYFLTTAKIDGADETPPKGSSTAPGGAVGNTVTRNLYLFDAAESGADRWKFIARLPYANDGSLDQCAGVEAELGEHLVGKGLSTGLRGNCFRGTPSGDTVLFATAGRLTGDDLDEAGDLYLYDAVQEELVRITAPPAGEAGYRCESPKREAAEFCNGELGRNAGKGLFSGPIGEWELSRGWGGMRYYNLSQASNGVVSAYFATELALVDEDTNDAMDVYEWQAGELSMISPPGTPGDSWFSGNSLDGEDVFFTTGARLDPREIDDADLDVYDARIGGGFPYTPPPTPCDVLSFGCESEAIAAPPARGAATVGATGSGNFKAAPKPRCPKGKTRRGKRCVKRTTPRKCRKASGKAKQRCTKRANAERRAGR